MCRMRIFNCMGLGLGVLGHCPQNSKLKTATHGLCVYHRWPSVRILDCAYTSSSALGFIGFTISARAQVLVQAALKSVGKYNRGKNLAQGIKEAASAVSKEHKEIRRGITQMQRAKQDSLMRRFGMTMLLVHGIRALRAVFSSSYSNALLPPTVYGQCTLGESSGAHNGPLFLQWAGTCR